MSLDRGALYAMKTGLLEAVRAELALTDAGVPARVCLYPGAEVAWDDCECGLLAVHHTSIWPSKHFPAQDNERPFTTCAPPLWVVEAWVTVVRCSPESPDESPPTCAQEDAAVRVQDADVEAMQRGVFCALNGSFHRVGAHVTVGPGGMCVGSALPVMVGLANCPDECG